MSKIKYLFMASVVLVLLTLPGFAVCQSLATQKILYIGGSFSLTGPYAADTAPALSCFEGYAKYVNENKIMAPWYPDKKFPADITLELLWRDDKLNPKDAMSIYEELKPKGMLVYTVTGSPIAIALMDSLNQDRIGASSMTSGPFLLSPPKTTFTVTPIYTDSLAAIADWFLTTWKKTGKPRVAYLTADQALGRSIEVPKMKAYLEKIGYEFVGSQYVPLIPTTPPTTQLSWIKNKNVDLTLGVMVHPGVESTMKEGVRLGMGPHLDYEITFGFAYPAHLHYCWSDLGELAEGLVVAGDFPTWDESLPGVKFAGDLMKKYHLDKRLTTSLVGLPMAMIQVEALRLALQKMPLKQLKPVDVLESGFYRIKNFSTGELTSTPVTYGTGDVEGIDAVGVDQVQGDKIVRLGTWPVRGLYEH
jgi:hypothetical protein